MSGLVKRKPQWLWVVVAITGWVTGVCAQETRAEEALRDVLRRARAALVAGEPGAAVDLLRAADRTATDSRVRDLLSSAYQRRAKVRYGEARYDLAYRDLFAANRLTPKRETVLQGLGWVTFRLGRDVDAQQYMRRVLASNADNVDALSLLGHLAQKRDDLDVARRYLDRAARLSPERSGVKQWAERVRKESEVEKRFITRDVGSFRIQFERGAHEDSEAMMHAVRGFLSVAHDELRLALGGAPQGRTTVVVYNQTQFRRVSNAHDWARAYFDGKVRVAVRKWPADRERLERDLRHELTHAYLRALYPKAPKWIHEGLAQCIEKRDAAAAAARFRSGAMALVDPAVLLGDFTSTADLRKVQAAYAECLVLVDHLRRKGGWRPLQQLLREFERSVATERALEIVYREGLVTLLREALR